MVACFLNGQRSISAPLSLLSSSPSSIGCKGIACLWSWSRPRHRAGFGDREAKPQVPLREKPGDDGSESLAQRWKAGAAAHVIMHLHVASPQCSGHLSPSDSTNAALGSPRTTQRGTTRRFGRMKRIRVLVSHRNALLPYKALIPDREGDGLRGSVLNFELP